VIVRSPYDLRNALRGTEIASEIQLGVTYRLSHALGGGGFAVAFYALRISPDGQTPVVMKVLSPHIVRGSGDRAVLFVQKEAVALGRLNEHVPPTPFVVRLLDVGSLPFEDGVKTLALPWLAIEYVHGGAEGTTLEERIDKSIDDTGAAFDPERAAHAIECLTHGLSAIHAVGVIHRDLKPDNVLCCSLGAEEIFKIADFGIARPVGMVGTFGAVRMGTPGYAPPEQLLGRDTNAASDVFSLSAVIYFLLTGEHLFDAEEVGDILRQMEQPARRSIREGGWISPLLADRPDACAVIDMAIAQGTAAERERRIQSASVLASMIVPALKPHPFAHRSSERRRRTLATTDLDPVALAWMARHVPGGDEQIIRSAAWDGDGRAMAVTKDGLAFWDGIEFRPVPLDGIDVGQGVHFVMRVDAGAWAVGGENATIALCTTQGTTRVMRGPDPSVRFVLASGDLNELAVFVGVRDDMPPVLYGIAAGHWIKPATLRRAASVSSLSRLDGERWIVTGRTHEGEGFAVIYEPLQWEVHRIKVPVCRAYLGSATRPELALGVIVGASGRAVRFEGSGMQESVIEGEPDLSVAAIDPARNVWAASAGSLWVQEPDETPVWRCAYGSDRWQIPFVSMFADVGRVIAMTADGGVLEGRATVEPPRPSEASR
jgi:serine/threonine protein kinase